MRKEKAARGSSTKVSQNPKEVSIVELGRSRDKLDMKSEKCQDE